MFEVILIDPHTSEEIGDIGSYQTVEEAESQATNYNRKRDRHAGVARVQTTLGRNPAPPKRTSGLRLSIRSNPRPVDPSPMNDFEIFSEDEEDFEPIRQPPDFQHNQRTHGRQRQTFNSRPSQPSVYNTPPVQYPSEETTHILLFDTHANNHVVLKDDQFARNIILSGGGRWELIRKGDFYTLLAERNKRNKGG